MTPLRSKSTAWWLSTLLLVTFTVIIWDVLFLDQVNDLFDEGRAIERATAIIFALCAGLWWLLPPTDTSQRHWHISCIAALMCMRELDWDKAFTTSGIMGLKLYTGTAPILEKIIGISVLLFILWMGLRLIRHNLGHWRRGIPSFNPVSWMLLVATIMLVTAKALDGVVRKLTPYGFEISSRFQLLSMRIEEIFELSTAILMAMTVVVFSKSQSDNVPSTSISYEYAPPWPESKPR